MKKSEKLYYNPFSHIYIEKAVKNTETAENIKNRFKSSQIIEIDSYRSFFNRKNQNIAEQKKAQSLILAKKEGELVYKGAPFCQSFGNSRFYYTSFVLGCVYDCEYCYLRGMYPSGNIVVFVNYEDFFDEIIKTAAGEEIFLCVSYDTDLLGLEGLLGLCKKWYKFASENKNINIELRTKFGNVGFLEGLKPLENFIIAITLSPDEIARKYEHKTAALEKRLEAARTVVKSGFPLRLSFDPILKADNFEAVYGEFIDRCFSEIDPKAVKDVGLGAFRISRDYLRKMRKNYPNSAITAYPYALKDGAYSYCEKDTQEMISFMTKTITKYINLSKLYLWKS